MANAVNKLKRWKIGFKLSILRLREVMAVLASEKNSVRVVLIYHCLQLSNYWENAVAEVFFKSLKTELLYGYKLMDKKQIRLAIFEYLEVWSRKQRRHSSLNYQIIEEFNEHYRKQNNKYVT